MNPAQRLLWLGGLGALLGASPAMANKVTELDIAPGNNPIFPTLEVYSLNGERWDKVNSNKTAQLRLNNFNAKCRWPGTTNRLYDSNFQVDGFSVITYHPSDTFIPVSNDLTATLRWTGSGSNLNPVRACNDELARRLANAPDKNRYELLAQGFTITVPAAVTARYQLICEKMVDIGRTDKETENIPLSVHVNCQGSKKAEQKIPPPPKQAKLIPLPTVKQAKVFVNHAFYRGQCPVMLRYKGHIASTGKGKFKYQFVHSDGTKTQLQTLAFPGAGKLATKPQIRSIYARKPSKNLAIGPQQGVRYDFDGWIRLKVIDPQGKVHWSPKQKVRVDCSKVKTGKPLKTAPKPPPQPPHQGTVRQAPKPAGIRLAPAPQ